MSINLQDLLKSAGQDLEKVKLVRHQDTRATRLTKTPWHLWQAHDGRFEFYQRIQRKPRFTDVNTLCSFVVAPDGRTLFVGLFAVESEGVAPAGVICPIRGADCSGYVLYALRLKDDLANYIGRLVIDWGDGARSWVQRAHKQRKEIIELLPKIAEAPFPGFADFTMNVDELDAIPPSWHAALSATRGIYLLVDLEDGIQYVGSATGADGFLGRWRAYFSNGAGGNVLMKLRAGRSYQVSILETASSTTSEAEIIDRESVWKEKLGSRAFGLNAN